METEISFYETTGFSMWPFLRAGEKVIIKRTPAGNLRTGDIILYRANNQLVCHRLVKRVKQGERYRLFARADSSYSRPETVTEEMFLGQAISIIKNGKVINMRQRKWQLINRLIVLVAPLLSRSILITRPCYSRIKGLRFFHDFARKKMRPWRIERPTSNIQRPTSK